MKTAEELFDKFTGREENPLDPISGVMGEDDFCDALTEHDQEIKDLVDEMVKKLKKENEDMYREDSTPQSSNHFSAIINDNKIRALTELKNKLGI